MSNCLVIQHVAPESPFAIADALEGAGVTIETRRVFEDPSLPETLGDVAGLVVMGGPMSAGSDEGFPTRRAEIALLGEALERGIPVLGVCLGAQLLAVASGGSVFASPAGPEIGWSPVTLSAGCATDPLFRGLPERIEVLQWHGETYEVPPSSSHLLSSSLCANQAFRTGACAWGLQFHLEVTEGAVEAFVEAFGEDAASQPGGAERIRRETPAALGRLAAVRTAVLGRFADLVAVRGRRTDLVAQG